MKLGVMLLMLTAIATVVIVVLLILFIIKKHYQIKQKYTNVSDNNQSDKET